VQKLTSLRCSGAIRGRRTVSAPFRPTAKRIQSRSRDELAERHLRKEEQGQECGGGGPGTEGGRVSGNVQETREGGDGAGACETGIVQEKTGCKMYTNC